ncbi:MAG: hypothetical protein EU539_05690 [Promethearchaeota archaeon]|nr:MAG: hypothetical protein EU539_05690 [Candidatus Lokiarchaeota archaeon]
MNFIHFFDEITRDHHLLGGKASNIIKLQGLNLKIPDGFIINTNFYDAFFNFHGLRDKLKKFLVEKLYPKKIIALSAQIRNMITHASLPRMLLEDLQVAFKTLKNHIGKHSPVAVRSSATIEDSSQFSFAGQAESYLYIHEFEELLTSLKNCWSSLFSPQALLYLIQMKQKGLNFSLLDIKMAVIVQKMINSHISGVLFTTNVLNNKHHEMMINSTWGLGETITNNTINPDLFIIKKKEHQIIKFILGEKEQKSIKNPHGSFTHLVETEPELRNKASLSHAQLRQLCELGLKIEQAFECPQDIEWAIEDDHIYILQSRPITTLQENKEQIPLI